MTTIPLSGMLIIPARFNGPPNSGNGGYACGLISQVVDGLAEVTLRAPPPLDTELDVARTPEGVEILDGSRLIATACRVPAWEISPPAPPTLQQAEAARADYRGHAHHEFPTCFTCGPDRDDGLRIFPGPVGDGAVASAWHPDASLPADDGVLRPEIVWAALDCPGAWASARLDDGPIVLGRMSATLLTPIEIDRDYVSYGWTMSDEGRKTFAGTAIADSGGMVLAAARQTWISV